MANSFSILILILFIHLLHNSHAQPSSLSKHFTQRVEQHDQPFLRSQDQTFSCGFYPVGTNAFSFSIWFTNSTNKTVVWTANRDSLVNGHGSEISFQHDGNLVLRDVNGSTVWSTSLISFPASTLSLLNNGNLVIISSSSTIWQSFDSPTDTLLPDQPLTKGIKVISAMVRGGISSGYYTLYFDNDNVLRLIYDGPVISSIYWPLSGLTVFEAGRTSYNSTRLAVLDRTGNFISSDGFSASASDLGPGIRRRLTVDYDGNLRMYSLNMSDGTWEVTWQAMRQLCYVHGLCGENAVCEYLPGLMCSCLPGYEMNDPSNWNRGCRPTYNYSCNPTQSRFVEVPKVDFYGFDLWYSTGISFHDCKLLCLRNYTCTGFSYRLDGGGLCYPKGTLFNGYKTSNFNGSFYLRLPTNSNNSILDTISILNCTNSSSEISIGTSTMFHTGRNDPKWSYLFIFTAVLGALEILIIVAGWWYLFKGTDVPKSVEEGYKMISSQFRKFTYSELKEVTGKFKEEIGKGLSGVVYRGVLDDKRVVAVKKLSDVKQGEEEFWAEVSVIGRINHINLVRMFGFCSESKHRLLVYEHIENQSLDKHLFNNNMKLQWNDRFKIAFGTAKGLAYLHHECLEWIIHCDVKPENILLTRDFEPKIADFGLAKLSKRDGLGFNFSHMRGTMGYMAPEWALSLPVTSKVDVYSYGVVLLEMVSGCRVSGGLNDGNGRDLRSLRKEVKQVLASGDISSIMGLVDMRLQGQFDPEQAAAMLRVAVTCLEEDRNQRPTMDEVVKELMAFEERKEYSSNSW
ncbi:Serine/threonine-protein kinase [Rhynchospora pubera]|uniref:Receptor-like serine/threonine-protein kinase n=1 Tax=Rhynchospora pubera TaxID=906938 RepID=A0AAV8HVQ8_9POAL|nr:Serine/threonine-protein kinase [Rhynchospora pubera]